MRMMYVYVCMLYISYPLFLMKCHDPGRGHSRGKALRMDMFVFNEMDTSSDLHREV